jgi:arylsulfatase A-like enzyme
LGIDSDADMTYNLLAWPIASFLAHWDLAFTPRTHSATTADIGATNTLGLDTGQIPLICCGLLLSSLGAAGCEDRAPVTQAPDNPHLVLITLDTTRRDRLGVYGSTRNLTPNIDAVGRAGMVFDDARTAVPITLPSHTSMLTAQQPFEHGIRENGTFFLPPEATTLTEHLKEHGYRTGAVVSSFVLDERFGLAQGFDVYDDEMTEGEPDQVWQGHHVEAFERFASDVTDRAIALVNEWRSGPEPFFLWIHYFDPHKPYRSPQEFAEKHEDPYDAEIASMDLQIGRLLSHLDESRLTPHTLVVIASDHGQNLFEHGETGHGQDLWESSMRSVLLMRMPGVIPPATEIDGRTGLWRIAPTVLELLQLPAGPFYYASSVPAIAGGTLSQAATDDTTCLETMLPALRFGKSEVVAPLDGQYKFILEPREKRVRLFDIENDPMERNDLAPAQRERVAEMAARWSELCRGEQRSDTAPAKMDEATKQKLRALGYIQ